MDLHYSSDGIYIPDIDLWLDPQVSKPACWISHAHSDHARDYSTTVFGTPVSLEVYRLRWPAIASQNQSLQPLPYGHSCVRNGATLTCLPAAHIVGAAQLLVEFKGERLLYTGDIKRREPICGVLTEIVPCDHLILESTFGLPVYHFLSRQEAMAEIVNFAKECLEDGATPAFFGYPLGRGQEVTYALTQAGIRTAVHGAIAKYLSIYEQNGYSFPGWEPYDAKQVQGRALVVVPGMRRVLEATGKDIRIAYVSGWARLDNARTRSGAEKLIPYSDHAGFDELLEIVEGSRPSRIDIIHGYTEVFAKTLCDRGWNASSPATARTRDTQEEALAEE